MYQIALLSPTYGQIILPVNPERLEVAQEGKRHTYELLNVGEVAIPGGRGLKQIRLSALCPAADEPAVFIERLESLISDKEVVRLIVTRCDMAGNLLWDSNLAVLVSGFSWQERGGEVGAVFYDLELTEYRPFFVRVLA